MTQATLLLVDDDVSVLSRLADLLDEAGYRVIKTSDTAHGGVLVEEEQPNLVILEVHSDRGAGWSLLKRIAPTTKVMVVSQQGLEEDVVRGLDAGAIDYISKPFRSQELLARVRAQLRQAVPIEAPVSAPADPSVTQRFETIDVPPVPAPPAEPDAPSSTSSPLRERQAAGRETVVMPYDDEHMLVDARAEAASPSLPDVSSDLPLGQRLHAARQQRRISLVQAENDLNIRMYYLQAIEEEKFALLPGATLTETFVNKYATYLGQDAKQALDEYRRLHYTQHSAPPRALGGNPLPRSMPSWVVWLVAIVLAVALCIALILWIDPNGAGNLIEQVRRLLGL